ncbi:MAG TPA: beta-ketoacyl synthase chain length factor [Pseudonocardiaceae bacterium]|nr:beta-ketoacyl synthase chain length factor [Pseudonocardiaceae bacterium]
MSGPMVVVTDPRPVDPAAVTTTQVLTGEPVVLARAEWPVGDEDDGLPQIAGFVMSNFSPLVAVIAERCLRAHYGSAPADPVRGATTGVVLASVRGDVTTVDTVAAALRDGRRVPPLLFFQSNPNAVVGHVTSRWGLAGPVVCTSPLGDPLADGLAVAALLIEDEAATEVLVIAADLADGADERDHAVAVLVAGTVG